MKRVRFETPTKVFTNQMEENECHSPRPFIERHPSYNNVQSYERVIPYSSDPIQRFECSNSSPYPLASKMNIPSDVESKVLPSNELNLSMLDASYHEPRQPIYRPSMVTPPEPIIQSNHANTKILSSIENQTPPQNVSPKVDDFFIRRNSKLDKYLMDTNHFNGNFKRLSLDKENNPVEKKAELMRVQAKHSEVLSTPLNANQCNNHCGFHHCTKPVQRQVATASPEVAREHVYQQIAKPQQQARYIQCYCNFSQTTECFNCVPNIQHPPKPCHWSHESNISPLNALERKTLAIQKLEQNNKNDCMEVMKQTNITKEKKEPTVADLFKIIKLQNEQLQLLQEKVDKFISVGSNAQNVQVQSPMIQQYSEKVVHSVDSKTSEQHKISIGVMTSFEMVRTSTVINKEFVKHTVDNAQIQCNRSQISIKEVINKNQPVNLNFLDGIMPVERNVPNNNDGEDIQSGNNEDRIINEFSLYDVQVDNAITPHISPEQSMYLDVRDYSDSESSSDDQSNVGWTYYNKVMTHVNGMLQDSDMPSSASALYRNSRQQCVQMQIDKTNLSVIKRVKFGDDPLGIHQPHLYTPSTDTSMKMNQLAAKYLKTAPIPPQQQQTKNVDMSIATRNYMERHKLLQGVPSTSHSPNPGEMPRFLDITALKQQPKFL